MSSIQVRQLLEPTAAELDQVTQVLVEAFKSDRLVVTCTDRNEELHRPFHHSIVAAAAIKASGEIYVASYGGHDIAGVAIWFGSGREFLDSPEQQDAGYNDFMSSLSPELAKWWMEHFLPKYDAHTASVMGEGTKLASWHLQMLGVLPEYQEKGIGGALVKEVEAKVFPQGIATCLETESEKNMLMYKRWGYVVKGQPEQFDGLTSATGFPMWVMMKGPKVLS